MKARTKTRVDYALAAKNARARVAELTAYLDAVPKKVVQCREAWADFGKQLLNQRAEMPSKKAFGAWIKNNKLDVGITRSPVVRSDAMWMAKHWAHLRRLKITSHYPSNVRQELRDKVDKEAREECRRSIEQKQVELPNIDHSPPHEKTVPQDRDTSRKSVAQERADRLWARSNEPEGLMSRAEFRLIQNCLKPDEQPVERQDMYSRALTIINRLEGKLVKEYE